MKKKCSPSPNVANLKELRALPKNKISCPPPPSPCVRCGVLHWSTDCDNQKQKCFNCNQMGHKSSHCRKKAGSSYVKTIKWDKQNKDNLRKYVPVQILGRKVNLQLDSGTQLFCDKKLFPEPVRISHISQF